MGTSGNRPIASYADFWLYYLQEHARPATRNLHYFGTAAATLGALAAVALSDLWLALAALVAGYGPAWIAHFFIEKNRPATFTYPLWSLVSDFRMAWFWATGRLTAELARAGVGR
ncbi:MAG TPA: DUF962 domain-containing protein [Rhizomicrobium sp.]|jgi:hypothetical protein|nr:DUF962 domain-containing protein [Rhizomicrobium sp.]